MARTEWSVSKSFSKNLKMKQVFRVIAKINCEVTMDTSRNKNLGHSSHKPVKTVPQVCLLLNRAI